MAIIRPPITGDPVQDSWTDQITKALNQGLIGTGSISVTGTGGGGSGEAGQDGASGISAATLYLFRRHTSGSVPPTGVSVDLLYDYQNSTITATDGSGQPFSEWYTAIPDVTDQSGNYVWVTTVNIAQSASDTAPEMISSSLWSTPASLTSPDAYIADPDTGQISVDGELYGYLYRYLDTAYSINPDGDGLVALVSELPSGTTTFYQGLRNSIDTVSSTNPSSFIWERVDLTGGDTTDDADAQYRLNGGRQIDWIFSSTFDVTYTRDGGGVIDLDNLSIPGVPPLPSTPTNVAINHNQPNSFTLSWQFNPADTPFPGLHAFVEEFVGDGWLEIAEVTYRSGEPTTHLQVENVALIEEARMYRVSASNGYNRTSQPASPVTFTPLRPSTPTNLVFTRLSPDLAEFSWDYEANNTILRYFVIEVMEPNETFSTVAIADAADRTATLTGVSTESANFVFRIRAVAASDLSSSSSSPITVTPPVVQPPTDSTVTPIERVGVLTTAGLSWTEPNDPFNILITYTLQFRPVTIPESAWIDVQTVSAGETEADNLPPQQGFVEYRIRGTAINGLSSVFVESGQVFISGGSATDDAIFGSDGDFISTRHYSVNDDDLFIERDAIQRVSGGDIVAVNSAVITNVFVGTAAITITIDRPTGDIGLGLGSTVYLEDDSITNTITSAGPSQTFPTATSFFINLNGAFTEDLVGQRIFARPTANREYRIEGRNGESLEVDWIVQIPPNSVIRNRHYYLNLDNLVPVGVDPRNWFVDRGSVFVEVLSDPAESERMYFDNSPNPDTDLVYTDAPGANATNTRTYDLRFQGGFMFATRDFIRLPMRRTFTFRDSGRVCIRLRFLAADTAHPRINFSAPISLEAYATERIDAIMLSNVTPQGTLWEYATDFEAPPMVFITPAGECTVYFTGKNADEVRIHTTDSNGCDVDVTARGR